jgi:predicted ATPase
MKLKQIRVDGYKNLIDCIVNLGDFNVLVGPNNSGKSNFLEAVQMLFPLCYGSEKLREEVFKGLTPRFGSTSSICHLEAHKTKPTKIGLVFEINIEQKLWQVDYELCIECDYQKGKGGFLYEKLEAKPPSNKGPFKKYIERDETKLIIVGKEVPIAKNNSSMLAIASLYPEYKGLPLELKYFVNAIEFVSLGRIYSISPKNLRDNLGSEKSFDSICISSFDLGDVLDDIKKNVKSYKLFCDTFCDILNLEAIHFEARDITIPSKDGKAKQSNKRFRMLYVERKGSPPASIEEFSDGTFATAAILATMFSEGNRTPMLFIEEPENYLHPAALKKLIRFLQDHADKWPVSITTHSPFLINGVNPEDVNVAVVADDGSTHFEKIKNKKALRSYLNSGLMSFGDMLASNFEEVLNK